jgi:hypothetical protein
VEQNGFQSTHCSLIQILGHITPAVEVAQISFLVIGEVSYRNMTEIVKCKNKGITDTKFQDTSGSIVLPVVASQ